MRKVLAALLLTAGLSFSEEEGMFREQSIVVKEETAKLLNSIGCKCKKWQGNLYYCDYEDNTWDLDVKDKQVWTLVKFKCRVGSEYNYIYLPVHKIELIMGIRSQF